VPAQPSTCWRTWPSSPAFRPGNCSHRMQSPLRLLRSIMEASQFLCQFSLQTRALARSTPRCWALPGGIYFVAARNGHLPALLSYVNPFLHTPIPAVIITTALSLAFLAMSDNAVALINYGVGVSWISSGMVIAGLLYLRVKEPPSEYYRPFKVNIVLPVAFLIICIFLVVVPLIQTPLKTGAGLCLAMTGLPVYFILVRNPMSSTGFVDQILEKLTKLSEKVFLIQPVDKGIELELKQKRSRSSFSYN